MDNPVPSNGLPPAAGPSNPDKGPELVPGPNGRPTVPRPRMSVSTVWIVAIMFAVLALLIVSQQGGAQGIGNQLVVLQASARRRQHRQGGIQSGAIARQVQESPGKAQGF